MHSHQRDRNQAPKKTVLTTKPLKILPSPPALLQKKQERVLLSSAKKASFVKKTSAEARDVCSVYCGAVQRSLI